MLMSTPHDVQMKSIQMWQASFREVAASSGSYAHSTSVTLEVHFIDMPIALSGDSYTPEYGAS